MPKGTIRRLIADRGFGFIKTEEGKDLFFTATSSKGWIIVPLEKGNK